MKVPDFGDIVFFTFLLFMGSIVIGEDIVARR